MAYCTRGDIELVFGAKNVRVWADLDGDGNEANITARIAHACDVAQEEIDSVLRSTPYSLPIKDESGNSVPIITEASAVLAGVYLYESRGVSLRQQDPSQPVAPYHPYTYKREWVYGILKDIVKGVRRLDAV